MMLHPTSGRGAAHLALSANDEAVDDFDEALTLAPDNIEAYSGRGLVHLRLGNYQNARDDFSEAIGLDPDEGRLRANRGETWLYLGEWDNARTDLSEAVRMEADIIASFRNDYDNVEEFELHNNLTLPADLREMLGG